MIPILVTAPEWYSRIMLERVLEKVKKLVNKADVDILDSVFDRAHRIGPKKETGIIVNFTTFRHRTLLCRVKKKLKTGV